MTIQEIIELDLRRAMSTDPSKRDLLRVVSTEMSNVVGKKVTDEEAIKILKKMIENAKLCKTLEEIPILEAYLPLEMSQEEINDIVVSIIAENNFILTDIGKIMGKAKIALGSDFDGGKVSKAMKVAFT